MNGIKVNVGIKFILMKYLLFLLLVVLCLSCTNKIEKVEEVASFPLTGDLNATIRPIHIPILLPRYMGALEDYLLVYKEREDHLFAFFDLESGDYIQDAGTRGQGPDEFNLLDSRSFNTGLQSNEFTVMEAGSNQLKRVKYNGEKISVIDSRPIFEQGVSNNGFYALADSTYLTLGCLEKENEYCLFDGKTGEMTEKGNYPNWFERKNKTNTPPLFVPYLKTCVVHPSGNKIAAFYIRFKRYRIYDNELNLLHDVDVKINPCHTNFDDPVQDQPVYYIGQPYATERRIYVLCANLHTGVDCHELQVWDWDGHPVACFKFDRKLSLMAISPKYGKIYALDNQVDNELYIYDLPKLD